MKYQVTVGKEVCFTQTFEIEARNEADAFNVAIKRASECQVGWEGGTDADYYVADMEPDDNK